MKEKLIDIVGTLSSCEDARKEAGISAFARVHCNFDGKDLSFWFTNDSSKYYGDNYRKLSKFGRFVPKNANIALALQRYNVGKSFEYDQLNEYRRMRHHCVVIENRSDFQNNTIAIAGDTLVYQYRSIKTFLSELRRNKEEIDDIEKQIFDLNRLYKQEDTPSERSKITKSINELQKEYRILTQQQEDLKNITIYIRKQGEMRYSPIVDPIQTRIKSDNLFNKKTVIINGGPGTGKSTTLIHRLAYLTDTFAINEDIDASKPRYKLELGQRRQLLAAIKSHRDWMFFSPSQMLKEYLATAMSKEGLSNTNQKVMNWKDYSRSIMTNYYGLLGDDTSKAPFRICLLTEPLFFQGCDIISEFNNYYLDQVRSIKDQLPEFNNDTVAQWKITAKNISQRLDGIENYSLDKLISLFNSLEAVYGDQCKEILSDKNLLISNLAKEICDILEQDNQTKYDLEYLSGDNNEEANDDNIEDDETVEESKFQLLIEKWLKAYSYANVNKDAKLTIDQQLIAETILPIISDKYDVRIQQIGELMVFEQYSKFTRGIKAIMLNGLPSKYKKFRAHLIRTKFEGCNLKLLRDVMQRKQGKELHHQEISLLLGFINTLVKQIKTTCPHANIKHAYIEAYDEVSRPIIGIDEATDFSVCDIYAMQSLLSKEFNSLTLCGDMMQRLTSHGIKSWSELDGIVQNPIVENLKTSYRQSKKLLDVARQIYYDTLGEMPTYKAFMKSNKVPDPLYFISENENTKIEWISKRISEVYRAYGEQLPSIALFVNDKGYIPRFIENLKNTEFFIKNKVNVLDGSKDNIKTVENHICVYPIDVVKGMEFDVVFFHNIDNFSVDTDIMKRYIYVGVSRAAFFLGITMNVNNDEISKYFKKDKDWFKI